MPADTSSPAAFSELTLTALPGASSIMVRQVVELATATGARRLLDLGCGAGDHARDAAARLPDATVTALDVSPANIDLARRGGDADGRIDFVAADYLAYRADPFDLIFSEGVFHLIPCDDRALAAKLAADLRPGGVLAAAMPYDCAANTALILLRRCLRALRGPWLDAAILRLARAVYPQVDAAALRERLPYMYVLPCRTDGTAFRRAMVEAGFELTQTAPWPVVSAAKLRHRLTVWRRRGDGGTAAARSPS
jgi:trans-aconitate 2-methyltransferase